LLSALWRTNDIRGSARRRGLVQGVPGVMLVRSRIARLSQTVSRLLDECFDLGFEVDGSGEMGHARCLSRRSMMRVTMRGNNFRRVEMWARFF
jgi:hypothetical protein